MTLSSDKFRTITLFIRGMHCKSCEILIEKAWKSVEGVEHVNVNQQTGKAELRVSRDPDLAELNRLIKPHGYSIVDGGSSGTCAITVPHKPRLIEIGAMIVIALGLYHLLKTWDLLPSGIGVSESMTYGAAFVMGLVASASTCAAVTGGILLALSASTSDRGETSTYARFKPHIVFNVGRIIGYTLGGAFLGVLGSVIQFSPQVSGAVSIIASAAMIMIGIRLLRIMPSISRYSLTMPKVISHGFERFTSRTPFFLGVITFVLPCGFTQALQLSVLSHGSAVTGALTMFAFALGTLPALLAIGLSASATRGWLQKRMMTFAGVVVLLLGATTMRQSWFVMGFSSPLQWLMAPRSARADMTIDPNVIIKNGKQIVRMKVQGLEYTPSRFRVREGMPVEWHIDGSSARGCSQVLTAPRLNLLTYLPRTGEKVIEFTPTALGEIRFSCSMGMTTPNAAFVVVPKNESATPEERQAATCDPARMNCLSS